MRKKPRTWLPVTDTSIWSSIYGAAFLRGVVEYTSLGRSLEEACASPIAEDACYIADAGVAQLKAWLKNSDYKPGIDIGSILASLEEEEDPDAN